MVGAIFMRAVIVASGPSARGFEPPPDVPVIAVNGAGVWLPRVDYWFSLDASQANRGYLRTAAGRGAECHVAGQPWLLHASCMRVARYWTRVDSLHTYDEPTEHGSPEWWMWRLGAVPGICKEQGRIHTGNSAWGALGLAWHLGFRDVALIGVDASTEARVEGGCSGNLSHLPMLFASALPDMNVVSCGALDSIPQMTFKDWYENR
jgi:hypothetical protein